MSSMTPSHKVVSKDEWLKARKEFLKKEKEFTKQRDELSKERRELPWLKLEKPYTFDGPDGPQELESLFGKNSQLLIYHFMFAPEWSQGCKSCSFLADHFNPIPVHLNHRDVSFAMVSRAPMDKITDFKQRMGWSLPWVSSFNNDFNHDFQVFFAREERNSGLAIYNYSTGPFPISDAPGLSVFYKDDKGDIFHTYSTYARGLDIFLTAYHLLDVVPKGRDEGDSPGMSWLRHHDRYEDPSFIDPWMEPAALSAE